MLREFDWRRHGLFAAAMVLICAGLFGTQLLPEPSQSEFGKAILLRAGVLCFMIWLALPQLSRLNPFYVIPILAVSVIAIARPQVIPIIVRGAFYLSPIIFLLWALKKPKRRSHHN